jgi:hypothetical protein
LHWLLCCKERAKARIKHENNNHDAVNSLQESSPMARATSVMLGCLLLACLAADVLAKPIASVIAKTNAIYDCPDTPRMKGCAVTGCALHLHGKSSTLVCAQCASQKAYVLVNENSRKAQCGEQAIGKQRGGSGVWLSYERLWGCNTTTAWACIWICFQRWPATLQQC